MEVLQSNSDSLQSQIPWGFLVPLSDPQAGMPDGGAQNLYNSGRTSLVLLFSSLWVAHPQSMRFDFIVIALLLRSRCGLSFVLGHGVCFFGGLQLQCQDGRVKEHALIFCAYLLWSSKELKVWAYSHSRTREGPSVQTQWLLPPTSKMDK